MIDGKPAVEKKKADSSFFLLSASPGICRIYQLQFLIPQGLERGKAEEIRQEKVLLNWHQSGIGLHRDWRVCKIDSFSCGCLFIELEGCSMPAPGLFAVRSTLTLPALCFNRAGFFGFHQLEVLNGDWKVGWGEKPGNFSPSLSLLWPLQQQMAAVPQRVSPAEKPRSDSSFFLVVPAHGVQYHHPSLCSPTWGCNGFLLFPISGLPLHPLSGSQLPCYLRKQFPAVSFLPCKHLKVLSVFLVRPWWYTPTHIHTASPNTGDLIFSSRTWACTLANHLPLLPPSLVLGDTWVSFSWDLFSLPMAILDGI